MILITKLIKKVLSFLLFITKSTANKLYIKADKNKTVAITLMEDASSQINDAQQLDELAQVLDKYERL